MTNQQILEKAINLAIDGGWLTLLAGNMAEWQILNDPMGGSMPMVSIRLNGVRDSTLRHPYQYIFNHDFAKAIWPDKELTPEVLANYPKFANVRSINWRDHLQAMVIAPDPIKYLGEHLN